MAEQINTSTGKLDVPIFSDESEPSPTSPKRKMEPVIIRQATLLDATAMGHVSTACYMDGPGSNHMFPHRKMYAADFERSTLQSIITTMLNPRNLTMVAVLASDPATPVAYAHFGRFGDDAGARRQIASRSSPLRTLERWEYTVRYKISNWLWPDRSADVEAIKEFYGPIVHQEIDRYWKPFPDRHNHWYAQRVAVSPEHQGRGIGRLLMNEVISRAREEAVPIGLAASPQGEWLYGKLGFELLGRFQTALDGDDFNGRGGMMIWWPESMRKA